MENQIDNETAAQGQKAGKFTVADKFHRHASQHHETDLTGEDLDKFATQKRNAYAIEHFLDPANVMILWD